MRKKKETEYVQVSQSHILIDSLQAAFIFGSGNIHEETARQLT